MLPHQWLVHVLSRTESISVLIADRIYPQGTQESVMSDHLVYTQTSLEEEDALTNPEGHPDLTRWTLECYSEDYDRAKLLAHRVRELFRRLREKPQERTTWFTSRVEDERDVDIVRYADGSKRALHEVDVDITVVYNPSAVE